MPNFPIVDAHIHLFDRSKVSYEWIGKSWPEIDRPHLMADLDKAAGDVVVEKAIYCELLPDRGHEIYEVEFIENIAKEDSRLAAMTASAPVELGAGLEAYAERLSTHPIVRGVRYHRPKQPDSNFDNYLVDAVRVLGRHGLHVEIGANAQGLDHAIDIARKCAEVPLVLVHMGMTKGVPDVPGGQLDPWRAQIKTLAGLGNVLAVKVSGTASVVSRDWLSSEVRPFVEHLVETFGSQRCMYASDWPASSFKHAYRDWVDVLDSIMSEASLNERQNLYRNTAMRVFRLA